MAPGHGDNTHFERQNTNVAAPRTETQEWGDHNVHLHAGGTELSKDAAAATVFAQLSIWAYHSAMCVQSNISYLGTFGDFVYIYSVIIWACLTSLKTLQKHE